MRSSVFRRFLLMTVLLFSAILVALGVQIYVTRQTMEENAKQSLYQAHHQVLGNINGFLDNLERILYSIGYNPTIQQYIKSNAGSGRVGLYADAQSVFSGITLIESDIHGITLYDKSMRPIITQGLTHAAVIQSDLEGLATKTVYKVMPEQDDYRRSSYYSLLYPIYELKNDRLIGDPVGAIALTINPSYIQQQIEAGNAYGDSDMLLVDEKGNMVVSSSKRAEANYGNQNYADTSAYILVESALTQNEWKLITFMPRGVIDQNMSVIERSTIVLGLALLCILCLFVVVLFRSILLPIREISDFMGEVAILARGNGQGGHAEKMRYTERTYAEFDVMADSMNRMLDSLEEQNKSLLQRERDYYAAVLEGNRMELLAYRNQINPHFLYNTLDCMRGIALYRNAPEVAEISLSLSRMFHYVVKGDHFVQIREEIEHVNEYGVIIGYRFLNRITIHCRTDEGCTEAKILRLMIQPLVENAVFHGVEHTSGEGRIDVSVTHDERRLTVSVRDNGIGIGPDDLTQLQAELNQIISQPDDSPRDGSGIGLSNIARRMRIFYGGRCSIEIESNLGKGTTVTLAVPYVIGGTA